MRFVCDSCRAQYMISDDKVGAKGVKVRCKKCGHVILVRPDGATASQADEAQETPAASAASNGGMNSTAAGLPASLGTPPEGGLFTDVEEDEIGAVFDQVLNSGSNKIPSGDSAGGEAKASAAAVRKLAEAESEPDEPQSSSAPSHEWFVAIDEKQVGPLTVEKVKDYWDRGEVGPDSLCWRQGFSDWIPLSDATELAPALAPRPAKPVIVAPAAMGQSSSTPAPVESAFSAGGSSKGARAEIPPAPALGAEPPSSGWKPSAASVLASLVKEENDALSKPPKPAPVAEKPAAAGLLDLPPPEAAPAARAAPMMAAAPEHAPQPAPMPYAPPPAAPAYAQPAPAYPQPAYAPAGYPQPGYGGYPPPPAPAQQGGSKTGLIAGIAVAAIAVVGVGLFFALKPSEQPATPPPVAAAPPAATKPPEPATPPPAAQTPPAVAAAAPAAPTAPATAPSAPAAAATPPAVAAVTPPPPAAVEPAAAKPAEPARTEPAVARQEPSRTGSKPRPSQSEPVASVSRSKPEPAPSDDDFDALFGSSKKTEPKKAAESTPSTYIPPAPGSGGSVREQLAQSDVMEVVLANRPAIVKCVNEQKKREPGSSGKLVMRWVIQTSGRTTAVAVRTEEFRKTYLATCISGLIKGWTFPKHRKQGDPIDFPFTF
ncbi:MJ0042 family finger-like domain-containing protein [Stigmatella aurantiaca]|uniref:MJ0042 family finger-like domain-containing protein n=1 Tax=Stigmatella aurantiaca TaxID=41 RepID=A0A1H8F368_STIAU|nr:adventurous gliding motility protein GltJ [Stigmatella aurantiaca]SEN25537.1 MJ0042 family finger-like domain-containing protein [Stigmatella aurantiaca]